MKTAQYLATKTVDPKVARARVAGRAGSLPPLSVQETNTGCITELPGEFGYMLHE
ncbi:hypothetical protein BDZ89DRAFT_242644 [Hymenopellis radicata]|nr:hypothetical protein BDZ89DRAFT_242644 [Hymenopellis radicata]